MSIAWEAEPLVDLGEDFDVDLGNTTSRPRRRVPRWWRCAILLIAVGLLVAASAPPLGAVLRKITRIPVGLDASAMINGSTIYVYDIAGGRDRIHAYALGSGHEKWSSPADEVATETSLLAVGNLVVLSMADTDANGEHTVAFDAATGRRVWTDDLGYAAIARGGLLVESATRPPGFNYPGTVPTATFQLLDVTTGAVLSSISVPVDCVTAPADPAGGPPSVLVELCSDSSTLRVVSLADGRTVGERSVDLGDPLTDFRVPPQYRMQQPELVTIGGTVMVAHTGIPTPNMDAYTLTDLRTRWTGLPVLEGQRFTQCGTALCIVADSTSEPMVDPLAGARIGTVPPGGSAGPADGSLVLLPVAGTVVPADASEVAGVPAGVSGRLPSARDDDATAPSKSAQWLARWDGRPVIIGILAGVTAQSCVDLAGYLACATAPGQLTVGRPARFPHPPE